MRVPGTTGSTPLVMAAAAACAASWTAFAAPPAISALEDAVLPRSGRLVILGSDLGTGQGSDLVLIDGVDAIVTTWTSTEVHAYVPESASLGLVDVQVVTSEGAGNIVPLEVTLRQPDGRVRWTFQMDRWMTRQFAKAAPDGTVYTADQLGLYALTADGGLKWFAPGAGGSWPISLGADGTIHTGSVLGGGPAIVRALDPDGSPKWDFAPSPAFSLLCGPNVGPDGNVYGAQETFDGEGLGAFSLDPDGALRWASESNPPLLSTVVPALTSSDIVFAPDRMYLGVPHTNQVPTTYAFRLDDGQHLWNTGNGDLGVLFLSFPRVDPQGRAIGKWGQTGVIVLEPDGETAWIEIHPLNGGGDAVPTVDSQGVIYTGDDFGLDLWAILPDGSTRWALPAEGAILYYVGVSPDDTVLVVGGQDGFAQPAWVRGYDTTDGTQLWQVDLLVDGGLQGSSVLYPGFSTDAATVYVTTSFLDIDIDDSGHLFAIDITPEGGEVTPGDLDGDGRVDGADLGILLGSWGPCAGCAADLDQSGTVDGADLGLLLGYWTT